MTDDGKDQAKEPISDVLADFLFGDAESDTGPADGPARERLAALIAVLDAGYETGDAGPDIPDLAAYIDGHLDDAQAARFEDRLLANSAWREELAGAHQWLMRQGQESAPAALVAQAKALAPSEALSPAAHVAPKRHWGGWFAPVSGAVAYGLVGLVVVAAIGYGTVDYYREKPDITLQTASAPASDEKDVVARLAEPPVANFESGGGAFSRGFGQGPPPDIQPLAEPESFVVTGEAGPDREVTEAEQRSLEQGQFALERQNESIDDLGFTEQGRAPAAPATAQKNAVGGQISNDRDLTGAERFRADNLAEQQNRDQAFGTSSFADQEALAPAAPAPAGIFENAATVPIELLIDIDDTLAAAITRYAETETQADHEILIAAILEASPEAPVGPGSVIDIAPDLAARRNETDLSDPRADKVAVTADGAVFWGAPTTP